MTHGHDDFAVEPIRGLPEVPPEGEVILWQGAPDWRVLALDAFHVGAVAGYFLLIAAWRGGEVWMAGAGTRMTLIAATSVLPMAIAALSLLCFLAYVAAKDTVYTITSRRVVLRFGMALTKAINLPFKVVATAALKQGRFGTGDIPLALQGPDRVPFAQLWPHVRPWHVNDPQPMLRAIPDAKSVASLLSKALVDAAPDGTARAIPLALGSATPSDTAPMPSGVGVAA